MNPGQRLESGSPEFTCLLPATHVNVSPLGYENTETHLYKYEFADWGHRADFHISKLKKHRCWRWVGLIRVSPSFLLESVIAQTSVYACVCACVRCRQRKDVSRFNSAWITEVSVTVKPKVELQYTVYVCVLQWFPILGERPKMGTSAILIGPPSEAKDSTLRVKNFLTTRADQGTVVFLMVIHICKIWFWKFGSWGGTTFPKRV